MKKKSQKKWFSIYTLIISVLLVLFLITSIYLKPLLPDWLSANTNIFTKVSILLFLISFLLLIPLYKNIYTSKQFKPSEEYQQIYALANVNKSTPDFLEWLNEETMLIQIDYYNKTRYDWVIPEIVKLATVIIDKNKIITDPIKKVLLICINKNNKKINEILIKLNLEDRVFWGEKYKEAAIKKGLLHIAKEATEITKIPLTDEQLKEIFMVKINEYEKYGEYGDTKKTMLSIYELAKSKQALMELMFNYCLDEKHIESILNHPDIVNCINLLAPTAEETKKIIRKILNYLIENKHTYDYKIIIKLAKYLPEEEMNKYHQTIMDMLLEYAYGYSDIKEAAKLLNKQLSTEELTAILERYKKDRYFDGYAEVCSDLNIEIDLADKINFISPEAREKGLTAYTRWDIELIFSGNTEKEVKTKLELLENIVKRNLADKKLFNRNNHETILIIKNLPKNRAEPCLKEFIIKELWSIKEKSAYSSEILMESIDYLKNISQ